MTSQTTRETYACKVIERPTTTSRKRLLANELELHRGIEHDCIVRLHHLFEDEHNFYLMLEYCTNMSLRHLVSKRGPLDNETGRRYLRQMVSAVSHLHNNCFIVHRDLKLGNFFLTGDMQLKLGDFGYAERIGLTGSVERIVKGTPNYMAPEVIDPFPYRFQSYDYKIDIWAIGVILYAMLVGTPPFETKSIKHTFRRIRKNAYQFPRKSENGIHLSEHAKRLIARLLQLSPWDRPTIKQVAEDAYLAEKK